MSARKVILIFLLCLGCLAPVLGQATKHVAVVIVSRRTAAARDVSLARSLAEKVAGLAHQEGLTGGQLPVIQYDFEDVSDHPRCVAMHIDSSDLLYVAVVDIQVEGPPQVLFYLRNVSDADRSARAVVESARGLLSDASETQVAESPIVTRQSVALYFRLLRLAPEAEYHVGAQGVAEVMKRIRTEFVDAISDRQMEGGMVLQVKDLLQAAGVAPDALTQMPLDSDLPARIMSTYAGRINPDVIGLAEVRGAMLALHDPFSSFLTPDQSQLLNRTLGDTASESVGMHLEVSRQHAGQIVVLDVLPNSPAGEAGLQPGDVVVNVNGQSVDGLPADLVSSMMAGSAGSNLVLSVQRAEKTWDVTLLRRVNKPQTVSERLLQGHVGYVRLSVFASTSGAEVQAALERLKAGGAQALILDLRNNGGGYVRAAQQICSLFLPKGKVVMSVVGRNRRHEDMVSIGPGTYGSMTVVVLVNGFTASAAEITAGCLRDHKVAYLMGSTTFGKGSMQMPFPFADQATLKLTVGRWYSPAGVIIDKVGLSPDFQVPDPVFGEQLEGDIQFKKAYELIRGLMLMPQQ